MLETQLGTGGFGEVWLAKNVNSHAKHVFKFCQDRHMVNEIIRAHGLHIFVLLVVLVHPFSFREFYLHAVVFGVEVGDADVGSFPGRGSSGAFDFAGNVREWCSNSIGDRKFSLGGAWRDVQYMFTTAAHQSPWNRDPSKGFRCIALAEGAKLAANLTGEIDLAPVDYNNLEPVSDEVFAVYRRLYTYTPTPMNATVDEDFIDDRGWRKQLVSLDTVYGEEGLILHIYLPDDSDSTHPAIIYFPGIDCIQSPNYNFGYEGIFDFAIKSGRAVVFPIYSGTYERGGGPTMLKLTVPNALAQLLREWSQDFGRAIDYLETRADIDAGELTFWGVSLGATLGPIIVGNEDRVDAAIFMSGGVLPYETFQAPPEASASTFLPRIEIPSLLIAGEFDYVFPVETAQEPFIELLGTPEEHKYHVIVQAGHVPLPRAPMITAVLDFLDRYQPIAGRAIVRGED